MWKILRHLFLLKDDQDSKKNFDVFRKGENKEKCKISL